MSVRLLLNADVTREIHKGWHVWVVVEYSERYKLRSRNIRSLASPTEISTVNLINSISVVFELVELIFSYSTYGICYTY